MLIYYHFKQTQAKYFLCQVQNQINYVRIKTEIDSTSKIIADGDSSHEIKRCLLLGRKVDQLRQHIKKQRHDFANEGPSSQSYGFPVVMYGCESWTIKKAEH